MLQLLAVATLLLTAGDHWTTYLCLRVPIPGWHVIESNPAVSALFHGTGLVGGLLLDSVFTLFAVVFVLYTQRFPKRVKTFFLGFLSVITTYAVSNNLQAMSALGISPLGVG